MTTTASIPAASYSPASDAGTGGATPTPNHCPSCDTFLHGRYCHACGELAPEGRNASLRAFAHQAFHEVLDVDSKTLMTFRSLFRRPGQLTVEYMAGRTKRYLSPLKLYLTVFAALMFAYTVYAPMRPYDVERMSGGPTGALAKSLGPTMAKHHTTAHDFLARWSDLWSAYEGWTQFLLVAVTACVLALLYRRSRRPMLEHTVLASHILAFNFAVSVLLWPAYFVVGMTPGPGYYTVAGVSMLLYSVYAYFALRRVYGQSGARTAVKTALFIGAAQAGLAVVSMVSSVIALVHALLTLGRAA